MATPPKWQVDRHIPVALIFAIVVQSIGLVTWAANLTTRVSTLEEQVKAQGQVLGPIVERSIRLETRLEAVNSNIVEMKDMLRSSVLTYVPGGFGRDQPTPATANPRTPALSR